MARRRQQLNWKEELKDLFAMHRGERRGFTVLLGLCIIAAAWVTWEQWVRPTMLADKEQVEVVWQSLHDTTPASINNPPAQRDIQLFAFNPNGLPVEQWVLLGLSEKQAEAIHRYEAHSGQFRTKRDLARMRVVDQELFAQWEPYIQLPDSMMRKERTQHGWNKPWPTDSAPRWPRAEARYPAPRGPLEINTADSTALVAIHGIGPAFARGIIRYRERLGGFASLDQLAEVPLLRDKPDAVERLRTKLAVDPAAIAPIHLNTCKAEDLGRHPYMGWKVAKALVAYRDQHGPFKRVDDITRCALVSDSIRLRMAPYLTVEHE